MEKQTIRENCMNKWGRSFIHQTISVSKIMCYDEKILDLWCLTCSLLTIEKIRSSHLWKCTWNSYKNNCYKNSENCMNKWGRSFIHQTISVSKIMCYDEKILDLWCLTCSLLTIEKIRSSHLWKCTWNSYKNNVWFERY